MTLSCPEPLSSDHDVESFSCGSPALERWLRTRALSNQQKGFTAVIVVHEADRVVGYYGSAPMMIGPASFSQPIRIDQAAGALLPAAVACLFIGQLATDAAWTNRGISSALLAHALRRCLLGARVTGATAVVVSAADDEAAAFWSRRGFIAAKDDRLLLFRSISDIAASLQAAGIALPDALHSSAPDPEPVPVDCFE